MAPNTSSLPVAPRPMILTPASPTEFLSYVISHYRYPSTIVIGASRQEFATSLARDALPPAESVSDEPQQLESLSAPPPSKPSLLLQTLLQIAVSRHMRIVFTPSVTHLRAWTTTFSPADSKVPPPPAPQASEDPALLVYGFIGLHRDTSEWSAQGLGASAASLVEAATRHGLRTILVEPPTDIEPEHGGGENVHPGNCGDDILPLLNGIAMKENGTWPGRTVEIRKVLSRWFVFEKDETLEGEAFR